MGLSCLTYKEGLAFELEEKGKKREVRGKVKRGVGRKKKERERKNCEDRN